MLAKIVKVLKESVVVYIAWCKLRPVLFSIIFHNVLRAVPNAFALYPRN